MAHEQILRGECIRLHIDVGFGHVVDETRFTNVGEASNDKGSCVRVDLGQSGQVLPHFFEVGERRL